MDAYGFSTDFYNYIHLPIQFLIVIVSFSILTNQKMPFPRFLKSVLYIFIPTFIIYVFAHWLGIIYFYISLIIFLSYRIQKVRTTIYVTLIFIVAIIADHMTTLLLTYFEFENFFAELIIRNILFITLHFLFISIFKLILEVFQTKIKLPLKVRSIIVSLLVITLIVFYYNIFLVFDQIDIMKIKINLVVFFLYFFLLIVLISMIFYILLKEESIRAKEIENKFFNEYVESLEETNKKMQKFQHDYLNILLSLKGYIDSEDWDGLKQYFNNDILNFERKTILENKAFGNLKNINVMSLKGLLLIKSLRAIDENLNISIEVAEPINKIPVDTIDLNRILGNLLDNAVENCIDDGKENIQIAIVKQENSTIIFRVSNEIGEKDINISQIFQQGYTTKSYGKGIGLYNVKSIVDKDPKMSINVWIEDGWFNVELIVLGGE